MSDQPLETAAPASGAAPARRSSVRGGEFGFGLGAMGVLALLGATSAPDPDLAGLIGLSPQGWPARLAITLGLAVVVGGGLVAVLALLRRTPGWARFAGLVAAAALGGFLAALATDAPFSMLRATPWAGRAGAAEITAFVLGAVFLALGAAMAVGAVTGAMGSRALTARERGQVAFVLPIMLGEGVLFLLLAAARLTDWSAPGAGHAALLAAAATAFVAAAIFSALAYGKLDEFEQALSLRQATVSFLVAFFLLPPWALAEAMGLAPPLTAFGAFLLLNAVYLLIGVPWSLWSAREEVAEAWRDDPA